MVRSSGRGSWMQGCQTDQCKWLANCKGWPARGVLKAQEALSLEDVQQEARRALVWLDFALNGHKKWDRAAAPFLGPFWQPLFS